MKKEITPADRANIRAKKRANIEWEKKCRKLIPDEYEKSKIYFDRNGNTKTNLTEIEID